jgi:phosphoglycolate phosphatase
VPRFARDELLKASITTGIEAVVFDLDGTLVDSAYDWAAIRARLEVRGPSIIDALNGLPEDQRSRRWAELETIEEQATAAATLFDGVPQLLALLHRHRLRTALVTNNTDSNTHSLLDRFQLDFDVVLTRSSGLWKPSGEPICEAMRRLAVAPEHTLAVGDSAFDLEAGRSAGCAAVVLLGPGARSHGEHADHAFTDVRALLRFLEVVL